MNNLLAMVIAGLLGGIAGGAVVGLMGGSGTGQGAELGAASEGGTLAERLARIEAAVQGSNQPAAALRGVDASAGSNKALVARAPAVLADDQIEAIAARVSEQLDAQVKSAIEAAQAQAAEQRPGRRSRKRVSLADAARELEMTGSEEDALRDLFTRVEEKAITLLAGEGGDTTEVRADLEMVRKDRSKAMEIMPKYLPKVLPKMGEFMKLEQERRTGMQEIVGRERAAKLNNDYNVAEADPFGMGGGMRMEVSAER